MSPPARVLRDRLLAHHGRAGRDLPWRRTRNPYAIWVSEIMLQQTRVESVIPYYRRWMERFPDVTALAGAELDDVLHAWAGLGYYSRARNLHRAAREVRDRFGGELPTDLALLRALPGIGPYTAGAIASIAFGVVTPAVDGNVRRVLSRLLDLPAPTVRELREHAAALVDPARPGDFNEALMELGATVCTPRSPRCGECPLESWCLARARGTVLERPERAKRSRSPHRTFAVCVVTGDDGQVLLTRRPEEGLLGGLWEFPTVEVDGALSAREASRRLLARAAGIRDRHVQEWDLGAFDHTFTHFRATYHARLFLLDGPIPATGRGRGRLMPLDGLGAVALPVAQSKIWVGTMNVLHSDSIPTGFVPDPPGDRINGRVTG